MKFAVAAFVLLLPACTATVWHPERTREQMRADIGRCTEEADRRHSLDGVTAIYEAFNCLEAMGYRRRQTGLAAQVDENLKQRQRPARPAGAACEVPCR